MAKEMQRPVEQPPEILALAEKLFVQYWQPGEIVLGKDPVAFAAMCFRGAQQFLKVSARIREGQTVEDIINPPEAPAVNVETA